MKRADAVAALFWLFLACGDDDGGGRTLVVTAPEPAGEHCVAGGVAILTGTDADSDGELDGSEVSTTTYVCDGAAGGSLVRVDDEPPGASCAAGGVAVHSGFDDDGDGVLDDAEIDDTAYVCADGAGIDDVIFGDVGIGAASDADRLVGIRRVTGSITIEGAEVTSVDLGSLEEVGGSINVRASGLVELDAPVLERVGDLSVFDDNAEGGVERISMPSLRFVMGEVFLWDEALASIDLGALERVGSPHFASDIRLWSETLTDISFPSLTYVRDDWQVSIPSLQTISAPALQSIGVLHLVESDALTSIDFSALDTARVVSAERCDQLALFGFPALREVQGFGVANNPQLTDIALPALTAAVDFAAIDNPLLPTCQATALATQSGASNVNISGNDDGGTCN